MSFDDLKTTLGMENLRCRCPEMVEKELMVYLSAHNLIRWLMAKAANHCGSDLDGISFKGSMDAFRQWSQVLAQRRSQRYRYIELWGQFLETIAADTLPYRPGRQEPRAVKKRSKYPHLNTPRDQYRGRPSRTQRRRKATLKKNSNP